MAMAVFTRAGLVAATLTALAGPARGNLIVNGSFETGPVTPGDVQLATGSTAIAGWVVSAANIDYVTTSWTAAQGFRSVGLNGSTAGGISQTFATIPSEEYTVRFYMAGDPETFPLVKRLRVSAAGQQQTFDVDLTGMWSWDPGWDARMFHFNANTTSTTVTFTSLETGAAGPAVDSITVSLAHPVDSITPGQRGAWLSRMQPNPVRDSGRIAFSLPRADVARVRVLDVRGREVAVLARGEFGAGTHHTTWNGNQGSQRAPAGIYLVELRTGTDRLVQRVVLLR